MRVSILLFSLSVLASANAQFSPDGGQPGSIAIHKDSVEWLGFATELELELGWLDVADTTLGIIDFFVRDGGIGAPDLNVQPLGDGGTATATFSIPISDGPGFDFVVFENGFATSDTTGFFELAFVEASSNGIDFFRFPSTSLSLPENFSGSFLELDSRLLDGLAGRFSYPFGAPYDLMDLPESQLLDKSAITHVRVVDVIGTSDLAFAKTDSDGMAVIDPYPTAFNSGGFDLDAIGIIHSETIVSTSSPHLETVSAETMVMQKGELHTPLNDQTVWLDQFGRKCQTGQFAPEVSGFYFVASPSRNSAWRRIWVN